MFTGYLFCTNRGVVGNNHWKQVACIYMNKYTSFISLYSSCFSYSVIERSLHSARFRSVCLSFCLYVCRYCLMAPIATTLTFRAVRFVVPGLPQVPPHHTDGDLFYSPAHRQYGWIRLLGSSSPTSVFIAARRKRVDHNSLAKAS